MDLNITKTEKKKIEKEMNKASVACKTMLTLTCVQLEFQKKGYNEKEKKKYWLKFLQS